MSAQKKKTAQFSNQPPEQVAKEHIDPRALALLTNQVRSLLAFHQEMGFGWYPASSKLRDVFTQVKKARLSSSVHEQRSKEGQRSPSLPLEKSLNTRPTSHHTSKEYSRQVKQS